MMHSHSKSFAADGVQVRERHNLVKIERVALALALDSLQDFFTELILDLQALREELQDARQRVRRSIHASEDHRSVEKLRTELSLDGTSDDSRHLRDELVVRELVILQREHVLSN